MDFEIYFAKGIFCQHHNVRLSRDQIYIICIPLHAPLRSIKLKAIFIAVLYYLLCYYVPMYFEQWYRVFTITYSKREIISKTWMVNCNIVWMMYRDENRSSLLLWKTHICFFFSSFYGIKLKDYTSKKTYLPTYM